MITIDVNIASRYGSTVIRSFRDSETERIFDGVRSRRFGPAVQRAAMRKMVIVDAAESLSDLRIPPGNRLEKLRGARSGQYSIRINDQWRLCFRWSRGDARDVEIADYH